MGILYLLAGVVIGVVVEHYFFKKDIPNGDASKIQAIIDKIDLIIDDIKKTV